MQSSGSAAETFTPARDEAAEASQRDLDWAVVRKVRAGNVAAFDTLVRKYRESIYSIIYNMTSNREDASDLTQETFIKAFQAIERFKGDSAFFTWLYRIAINTSISFLKKRGRRRYISYESIDEEVSAGEIFERLTAKTQTEEGALRSELQEKLNDALQKLSPKHRSVVVLHEIEGLEHAEIAEITKTSIGTVRSRLHYAKRELQSHLQDYLK